MKMFFLPAAVLAIAGTLFSLPTPAGTPPGACKPSAKGAQHAKAPVACGEIRTKKSRLGVKVAYTIDAPAPDGTSAVHVTVSRGGAEQPLTIEMRPDAGLKMPVSPAGGKVEQAGPTASYDLTVVPRGEGLQYVNLFLRSGSQVEVLSIPVQSGKTPVIAKPVAVQTMPNGERVIAVPAQP